MKKIIITVLSMFIVLSVLVLPVDALMPVSNSFIVEGNERVTIPISYTFNQMVSTFSGAAIEKLNNPQDIYYDSNGYYYIADTGNNRVLKLDLSFKVVSEFITAGGMNYSSPTGVSVDSDGDIYIADAGNNRVVHLTSSGEYSESFVKPESDLLYDVEFFSPSKVEFDPTSKFLYVIQGKQFMKIDALNQFKGYIGDNKVGFDLWDYIFRKFASEEQKMQQEKRAPDPYTNFCISKDGKLYAVGLSDNQRISIINTVGKNIYPSGDYGETLYNNDGSSVTPIFTDIAVNSYGIIFVCDENTSCIYQYDSEGNMLGGFGGKGAGKNQFNIISSMVINGEDQIVTLDSALGRIQVFEATDFTQSIHKAVDLYSKGQYDESYELWESVRNKNPGYSLARHQIGKIEYKNKKYNDAANEFYQGNDRENYGKAFSKMRYQFFKDNFTFVMIAFFVVLLGVIFAIKFGQKKINKMRKQLWDARRIR